MIRFILLLSLFLSFACSLTAKDKAFQQVAIKKAFIYRLYLKDKNHSPFTLSRPDAYLSQRALERRKRQGIAVDSTDLPVSPAYVESVRSAGLMVLGTSRWHNTILVSSPTDNVREEVRKLPFVKRCLKLYVSPDSMLFIPRSNIEQLKPNDSVSHSIYGDGWKQIKPTNGYKLHELGFRGKGKLIAILDAGFHNADRIPAMKAIPVVATADFAPRRAQSIFAEHYHGTMVLSVMGTNQRGKMTGTAPEADYALIRTEDTNTETRAEEDSWTMGAEYADSIGADLINSSLGYTHWDGDSIGPYYRDLNGRTSFVSQTASMLASKGIVLCSAAGNEGCTQWHKISVPADANDILTVGAVSQDSTIALFSSLGPSQDGRVKPDVCGPGEGVSVIDGAGALTTNNGTSFASPIICGLVACLWQALPGLNAKQIIDIVRSSADRHQWPDNVFGYGIPDFMKAYNIGASYNSQKQMVLQ